MTSKRPAVLWERDQLHPAQRLLRRKVFPKKYAHVKSIDASRHEFTRRIILCLRGFFPTRGWRWSCKNSVCLHPARYYIAEYFKCVSVSCSAPSCFAIVASRPPQWPSACHLGPINGTAIWSAAELVKMPTRLLPTSPQGTQRKPTWLLNLAVLSTNAISCLDRRSI